MITTEGRRKVGRGDLSMWWKSYGGQKIKNDRPL